MRSPARVIFYKSNAFKTVKSHLYQGVPGAYTKLVGVDNK